MTIKPSMYSLAPWSEGKIGKHWGGARGEGSWWLVPTNYLFSHNHKQPYMFYTHCSSHPAGVNSKQIHLCKQILSFPQMQDSCFHIVSHRSSCRILGSTLCPTQAAVGFSFPLCVPQKQQQQRHTKMLAKASKPVG